MCATSPLSLPFGLPHSSTIVRRPHLPSAALLCCVCCSFIGCGAASAVLRCAPRRARVYGSGSSSSLRSAAHFIVALCVSTSHSQFPPPPSLSVSPLFAFFNKQPNHRITQHPARNSIAVTDTLCLCSLTLSQTLRPSRGSAPSGKAESSPALLATRSAHTVTSHASQTQTQPFIPSQLQAHSSRVRLHSRWSTNSGPLFGVSRPLAPL
jgi:hypothetical protein